MYSGIRLVGYDPVLYFLVLKRSDMFDWSRNEGNDPVY